MSANPTKLVALRAYNGAIRDLIQKLEDSSSASTTYWQERVESRLAEASLCYTRWIASGGQGSAPLDRLDVSHIWEAFRTAMQSRQVADKDEGKGRKQHSPDIESTHIETWHNTHAAKRVRYETGSRKRHATTAAQDQLETQQAASPFSSYLMPSISVDTHNDPNECCYTGRTVIAEDRQNSPQTLFSSRFVRGHAQSKVPNDHAAQRPSVAPASAVGNPLETLQPHRLTFQAHPVAGPSSPDVGKAERDGRHMSTRYRLGTGSQDYHSAGKHPHPQELIQLKIEIEALQKEVAESKRQGSSVETTELCIQKIDNAMDQMKDHFNALVEMVAGITETLRENSRSGAGRAQSLQQRTEVLVTAVDTACGQEGTRQMSAAYLSTTPPSAFRRSLLD